MTGVVLIERGSEMGTGERLDLVPSMLAEEAAVLAQRLAGG